MTEMKEDRKQKTEDRRQKTEDRGNKGRVKAQVSIFEEK